MLVYNVVFWMVLCVLDFIKSYTYSISLGQPYPWYNLIRWPFSAYICFWILSFLIFNLYLYARTFSRRWWILFHGMASVIFGILHRVLSDITGLLLERLFLEKETKTWIELVNLWPHTFWNAFHGMIMYWVVILILIVLDRYRHFRDQEMVLQGLEESLSVSRLQTMKIQLRPHFLFNALHTIAMMVRKQNQQEAVNMISGLSDMLRSSLSHENKQFVTLEEELTLINHYLKIESVRYQDRLEIKMDIAENTLSVKIPNLILQPIVENAFKHGVARTLDNAFLQIGTRLADNKLLIEVFNSKDNSPFNWDMNRSEGIGLTNTLKRLMRLYQGNYKFHIYEKENGIAVQVTLPARYT